MEEELEETDEFAVLKEGELKEESGQPKIHPVQFANLKATTISPALCEMELLMDVPLKISVELGRTKKLVKELLEIKEGSIIEIDKLAGEPVDIMINGKLIARGGIVIVDENLGVRITDIVELPFEES
jgi:flagellar motor switch protein FliN/FliY